MGSSAIQNDKLIQLYDKSNSKRIIIINMPRLCHYCKYLHANYSYYIIEAFYIRAKELLTADPRAKG